MRIQFSNEDKKVLEQRTRENKNYDNILIPVEMQEAAATLTFVITDPHKFNLFMEKFIKDQELDGENTTNVIGAQLVRLDRRPPIDVEDLIKIRDFLDEIIYGPKQQPDQEDIDEATKFDEYSEDDSDAEYDEPISIDKISESVADSEEDEDIDYGCIDGEN